MLPPGKSEFEQDDAERDREAQLHVDHNDALEHNDESLVAPGEDDLESDGDAELDEGDELGQDEQAKPKRKGLGKGTMFAALGVGVVLALAGTAYVMQGQMKAPAPVSKKIAIDPSLLESKPAAPRVEVPTNPVAVNTDTPNLNGPATAPVVSTPSASASISSPPSDPFAGATPAPVQPTVPAAATAPVVPAVPVAPVASAPVVAVTPTPGVSITPAPGANAPRVDPFGAVAPELVVPKVEKPLVVEKPAVEVIVKPAKVAKARPVITEEIEISKPRAATPRVRKPSVVRQDMTVSQPHPSQERVQPQSSESFHGYEKLF